MDKEKNQRYFFFGLFFIIIILTFLIFKPFWIILILSGALAIALRPIYQWFQKSLPNWLSAAITVFIFLIIVCGPLLAIGKIIVEQSQDAYRSLVIENKITPALNSINEAINKFLPGNLNFDLKEKTFDFAKIISNNLTRLFSSTLSFFFSFLLTLLGIFYFLKDGPTWVKKIVSLNPLSLKDNKKIITRLTDSVNSVLRGSFILALIQGTLLGFGFALLKVPQPALWAILTAIASFIPAIGPVAISIPVIIFMYASGQTLSALGVFILAIILGTAGNLISPYLISNKTRIPPFFILFSVLGGIAWLGPIGILIGPLTLSFLYALITIYQNEFQKN